MLAGAKLAWLALLTLSADEIERDFSLPAARQAAGGEGLLRERGGGRATLGGGRDAGEVALGRRK